MSIFNNKGKKCTVLSDTALVNNDSSSDCKTFSLETWGKLDEESSLAFTAFCAFRDFGPERSIIKVVTSIEKDSSKVNRAYSKWRTWSALFNWNKRAADYDKHLDSIRLYERRKTIEEREEAHKKITEKMLLLISKKLDMMNPQELSQNNLTDWVKTAIQTERQVLGIEHSPENKQEQFGQLEIKFENEFKGI